MLSPRSPGGAFPFLSPRATTNSQHHSDVSTSSAAGGPNGLTEIDASFLISRIRNRVKELATDLSYTKKAEQAARDDSRKLYERIALLEQELATEKANSIAATNKLQLLETLSVSDNASSAAATSSSSSSTTGEERARREATRLRELNSSLQADLVSLRAAAIEHAAAASEWEHTRAQLQSRISTQSSLIDDLQATCRTTQDALSATKITSAEFDAIVSEFRAAASASALRSVNDDTRVQELRLEGARLTRALEAAQSDLVTAARAQAQAEADRDEARARAAASKEAAEAAETAVTGAAGVRAQMSQALARVAQLEKVLVGFLPPPPPPSAPSIVSAPSSAVTPAAATIISSPTISAAAAAGAAPESPTREPQAKRPCPPLRHSQTRQVETSSEAATAGANTAKSSSTEKETDVLRDGSDDMPPLESLPAPIMTSEKSV